MYWGVEVLPVPPASAVDVADRLLYACLARGLSFKVGGGNVVTLCPPLNISADDLGRALEILGAAALEVEMDLAGTS
jgi:4-aminobutyrate aminotransferase